MKKTGPSLYYASDKNILDALNQSKVDNETLQTLFRRRNIVCSKSTKREDLARFFSRLTHDLLDHHDLSDRLGVVSRREKVSAVDLIGTVSQDALQRSVDAIRERLAAHGDIVQPTTTATSFFLNVKYSIIDYKKSEFSQLQHRNGVIELIPDGDKVVVRSSKGEYLDEVRDDLIRILQAEMGGKLERREVSLFHHPNPEARSQFFFDLITNLPGYARRDVTDVFVYKPLPGPDGDEDIDSEPHIDRIVLRGRGISQSELLRDLTKEKSYYIAKVGWIATELLGVGAGYDIEATFSDPVHCTGFSYILRGVFDLSDHGRLSKARRNPIQQEIDTISRVIEQKARDLIAKLDSSGSAGG